MTGSVKASCQHGGVLTTYFSLLQVKGTAIQCQICYMRFLDQSAINIHYETAHIGTSPRAKPGEGAHACDHCDKRYTSKQSLRHHLATSHSVGEAPKFGGNGSRKGVVVELKPLKLG